MYSLGSRFDPFSSQAQAEKSPGQKQANVYVFQATEGRPEKESKEIKYRL
jgi:hypothetical protein